MMPTEKELVEMPRHELSKSLKSLGSDTTYEYDRPNIGILETFPAPKNSIRAGVTSLVLISSPEFTSLCPKTGQPDFATIIIEYLPRYLCVESKSVKLYLGAYRQHRGFHEECVAKILDDIEAATNPFWIAVQGRFTPRGGIPFWPLSVSSAPDMTRDAREYTHSLSRLLRGDVPVAPR